MPVNMCCFNCRKPFILSDGTNLYEKYISYINYYEDNNLYVKYEFESSQAYALFKLGIWKDCCRQLFLTIKNMDDLMH